MTAPGEPPTTAPPVDGAPAPTSISPEPAKSDPAQVSERIPLPPPAAAPAVPPRVPGAAVAVLDGVLLLLVLALAFLIASFPARNSDLWLHLAAGRSIAEGNAFGHDPFAQGTEGVYWVNSSWLFDRITYGIYQALGSPARGGAGLVVLKAALVVLLAGVLVLQGRAGHGLSAPVVCAALALLAIGDGLLLQPMCVSYLFLALTLLVLERPWRRAGGAWSETAPQRGVTVSVLCYWPLLPLFVLWVNLDAWFLLGPLAVALYLVGQLAQRAFGPDRDDRRAVQGGEPAALGLALAAGLAACFVNPHFHRVFLTLPSQLGLSPAAWAFRQSKLFPGLVLSPFQAEYFKPTLGWNAAGLAFFPLALLSGLSFGLQFRHMRWRRALVWLVLFLLAACQMRAIPFFAVAAGPIMALNLQEHLARRFGAARLGHGPETMPQPGGWGPIAGRVLAALLLAALATAAWPGWLQAAPYERRGWSFETDPAQIRTAQNIAAWRRDNVLGPDDRAFNFSPDMAHYFAWFCPEEKGFLDTRLPLFPAGKAGDFLAVRDVLAGGFPPLKPIDEGLKLLPRPVEPKVDKRDELRKRKITHLVVQDDDLKLMLTLLGIGALDPDEWPLVSLEGRVAVFGWRDPKRKEWEPARPDPFAALALDWDQVAFHPSEDKQAPDRPLAPPEPAWTDPFVKARRPRSPAAEEAAVYLELFDRVLAPRQVIHNVLLWDAALVAGPVGDSAGGGLSGFLAASPRLHLLGADRFYKDREPPDGADAPALDKFEGASRQEYMSYRDDGPPGLLLAAVRAARRALHDNPEDIDAYLNLGKAYLRLYANTRARNWEPHSLLGRVRLAQAAAAFAQALRLNPDLDDAHMGLMAVYKAMNYRDLILKHYKQHLRCVRAAGRPAGMSQADFAKSVAALEQDVGRLEKYVNGLLDQFELQFADQLVFTRAANAEGMGLGAKALSILLASDVSVFGKEGMQLELELMLAEGRIDEVRKWMTPDQEEFLGSVAYKHLRIELAAASGNYVEADDHLVELIDGLASADWLNQVSYDNRSVLAFGIAQFLLDGEPHDGYLPWVARRLFDTPFFFYLIDHTTLNLGRQADYTVLRGLLAVEKGDVGRAKEAFQEAVSLWKDADTAASGGGLDFGARGIAQEWLERLKAAER